MIPLFPVASILLNVAFLMLITLILRGFRITGWPALIGLAVVLALIQTAVALLLPAESFGWIRLVAGVVAGVPALAFAGSVSPNVRVGGGPTLALSALLLVVLHVAASVALFALAIAAA